MQKNLEILIGFLVLFLVISLIFGAENLIGFLLVLGIIGVVLKPKYQAKRGRVSNDFFSAFFNGWK